MNVSELEKVDQNVISTIEEASIVNTSDISKIAVGVASALLIKFGDVTLIAVPAMISDLIAGPNASSRKIMFYVDHEAAEVLFDFDSSKIKHLAKVILNHEDLPLGNAGFSFDDMSDLRELFIHSDTIDASVHDVETVCFVFTKNIAVSLGLPSTSVSDHTAVLVTHGKSMRFILNMVDDIAISTIDSDARGAFINRLSETLTKASVDRMPPHANGFDASVSISTPTK